MAKILKSSKTLPNAQTATDSMSKPRIILASASPRRKELLSEIIPNFEVIRSDFDESNFPYLYPRGLVRGVSQAKAKAVLNKLNEAAKSGVTEKNYVASKTSSTDNADLINKNVVADKTAATGKTDVENVIIAADTVVYKRGEVFGKPTDSVDAICMLLDLNGKWHSVYTGVCVLIHGRAPIRFVCHSRVKFKKLTEAELSDYLKTARPLDKAGSYGIQDGVVVEKYKGSLNNIIGLPTEKLIAKLKEAGII